MCRYVVRNNKKPFSFCPFSGQNRLIMLISGYVKTTNDQNFKEISESSGEKQDASGLFWHVHAKDGLPDD